MNSIDHVIFIFLIWSSLAVRKLFSISGLQHKKEEVVTTLILLRVASYHLLTLFK